MLIHSTRTLQLSMVVLTVPYENKMEEVHFYESEKRLNMSQELGDISYKAVVCPLMHQRVHRITSLRSSDCSQYVAIKEQTLEGYWLKEPNTVPAGSGSEGIRGRLIRI